MRSLSKRLSWHSLATVVVLAALLVGGTATKAQAQIGSERYSSIVVDATSGAVLSAVNADEFRFPASLTKMMTLYMVFEALRDRRIGLNQAVPVSSYAASMSPTKLGLLPGTHITVEQAILGLVTKSANDAAAALGELLGGDEDRFAQIMTLRARSLGMRRTTFRNASGLPDWEQVTTARDMAVLARHLIDDFPGQYHYFSTPSFVWHGRMIKNHGRLLETYAGADGLKTGYTVASGFNLATSALRGRTRLIGVVLGASSSRERDLHMASLLDVAFDRYGEAPVFASRPAPTLPTLISAAAAAPAALARTARRIGRPLAIRSAAAVRQSEAVVRRKIAVAAGRRAGASHAQAGRLVNRPLGAPARTQRIIARPALRTDRITGVAPKAASARPQLQRVRASHAGRVRDDAAALRPEPLRTNILRPVGHARIRG